MLKFNLIEETMNKVVYEYFPENGTHPGVVSYDKKTNECNIVALAEKDRHHRYALKMFSKIREFANEQSFKKEGTIVWY